MYVAILSIMASVVVLISIPIAIALASPQEGTRLAPERNPALRNFGILVALTVAALLLFSVFSLF